jgi:sec-independent protein translocase protein TatB
LAECFRWRVKLPYAARDGGFRYSRLVAARGVYFSMFDFSWSELLLIGIVALVFIGPKELPGVLRTLGQWMNKIRRMASEFQNQFHEAMREAELADLKKEVEQMTAQASNYSIDPLTDVKRNMEMAQRDIEGALAGTPLEGQATGQSAGESAGESAGDNAALSTAAPAETTALPAATAAVATEPVKESAAPSASAGDMPP